MYFTVTYVNNYEQDLFRTTAGKMRVFWTSKAERGNYQELIQS